MPPSNKLLMELVAGQKVMSEQIGKLDQRLFGGEGQEGTVPLLFEKLEEAHRKIQEAKDKAAEELQAVKNKEIKALEDKTVAIEKDVNVTMWKTGSLSSIGGAGVGIGFTFLIRRLLGLHP
jgi:hypothetical protein